MKVIILNAGIGKRFLPLTKNIPKCLIKINDKDTILDNQLKNLIKCDLKNIVMLTGPFEEKIKELIETKYPNLKVQYVRNPVYDKTNYIYSMFLLKDIIDDDVLLLHGDLVFPYQLLKDMLNSSESNCVLVNKVILPPEKVFKALIFNDRIKKISVNLTGSNTAFLTPLYKLTTQFFKSWLAQIEKFIDNNQVNSYAEDALNEILNNLFLKPLYYKDLICMEIDNFEDLKTLKKLLQKNERS